MGEGKSKHVSIDEANPTGIAHQCGKEEVNFVQCHVLVIVEDHDTPGCNG